MHQNDLVSASLLARQVFEDCNWLSTISTVISAIVRRVKAR
jgi:hypothetical protein